MFATNGPRCLEQFGKFSRPGLWQKMFAALLIGTRGWYSMKCRLTWKLKATKSHRFYFQLVASTPRIDENGFGLLPTPKLFNGTRNGRKSSNANLGGSHAVELTELMAKGLLPTPIASDSRNLGGPKDNSVKRRLEIRKQVDLTMMVDGQLSPLFILEMMGFPPNWTELPFLIGRKNQLREPVTQ